MKIMAHELHTIKWKHLQIAIARCKFYFVQNSHGNAAGGSRHCYSKKVILSQMTEKPLRRFMLPFQSS